MAEQLATADGQPIDVDRTDAEFAAAMATPPGDDTAAPPKLDPPDPDAPYGRTAAGKPKKGPGGRPARDRARVTDKAAGASSGPASVDYAAGLADTIDGAAVALTLVPYPMAKAQAAILARNKTGTITGLTLAAEHNAFARRVIAPLATGQASWYILAALALAPAVMQSAALWRDGPGAPYVAELAAEADASLAGQLARLGIVSLADPNGETTESDAADHAESSPADAGLQRANGHPVPPPASVPE